MNIAIIPARGNSKGIPCKNVKLLAGRPLIAWTIEQAKKSALVYDVFVSTDDEQIADVSRHYGARIIARPPALSKEISSSEDALVHAVDHIESVDNIKIDLVVFLQATSPLRKPDDIDKAITMIIQSNADSLFSAVRSHRFIWRRSGDRLKSINYDYKNRPRRQDLDLQYVENGSIYVFKPEVLRRDNNRLGGRIAIFKMEFWQSCEIDDPNDLEFCEVILNKYLAPYNKAGIKIEGIRLVVYDFDGVMTNSKVIVDQTGKESVFVNRADGLAVSRIKAMGIPQVILSTEENPVVLQRAKKLGIPCLQGVENKKDSLKKYLDENQIDKAKVLYVGNDINDFEVMQWIGFPVAPSDASPAIKRTAKVVTRARGGDGVIRELLDILGIDIG